MFTCLYFSRKSLIRCEDYPGLLRSLRIMGHKEAEIPLSPSLGVVAASAYQLCYADLLIKTF
jgi:hypothetical protein